MCFNFDQDCYYVFAQFVHLYSLDKLCILKINDLELYLLFGLISSL